jgi:hypothetical protein
MKKIKQRIHLGGCGGFLMTVLYTISKSEIIVVKEFNNCILKKTNISRCCLNKNQTIEVVT